MFKKAFIVLAVIFVLGAIFGGNDEEVGHAATDIETTHSADQTPHEETEDEVGEPTESASPTPTSKPKPQTFLVGSVVDGDTIELGNGESVRIVGIDTPERGDCGYDRATTNMERMVLGKQVRLGMSDEDRDKYGRLLRYVNVGKLDVGLAQIERGLAIARYDSRDGYGFHPRENRYVAADKASKNFNCALKPKSQPVAPQLASNCAEGYNPCIPPYPPDVNCSDVNGPIYVTGSDPHGLDGDGDGVACES